MTYKADFTLAEFTQGGALANSTTATRLLAAGEAPTIPSQYFAKLGGQLEIEAWGRISNIVTTPGTLTLHVRFGSTVVWNGGAIPLNTTAKTNVPWRLRALLSATTLGASGTLIGVGEFQSESVVGSPANSAGGNGSLLLPVGNPANGNAFDTEAAHLLSLFGTWSIANAGNSIQLIGGRVVARF